MLVLGNYPSMECRHASSVQLWMPLQKPFNEIMSVASLGSAEELEPRGNPIMLKPEGKIEWIEPVPVNFCMGV
jgi:hypothetical protein